MSDEESPLSLDGIAVVGLAGRFPGSRDCDEFWANLREGREGLTLFTEEEIEDAGYPIGPNRGKRVRSRGVVEEADYFDASFFGFTPREAEIMDPQQRVFLEVAWTALENAGFDPDRVPGAVGVYAGASINTYYPNNVMSRPDVLGPFGVFPAVTLNEKDFLATRVAYKLNLRGPAISVQTACSTSLVAVCNAAQSLLNYECDLALAGGVAINYPHCHSIIHEDGGMISTDGHCKPFDRDATGTLFSDGAGAVVLRRLEDAVEDGDTILAVIKGYALNNDGSEKAGFTAPSVSGQSEVIQMAQAFGDIEPDSISYVEAHGTATVLGDPIEIAGLTQAFRTRTDASQFCALGSVKSNIGHLDVAAGIAGFIKTVLALHHQEIPPTVHFNTPNPNIDFSSTPFYVADKLTEWKRQNGGPRRAGVSSFGVGGTNAHVVLEESPQLAGSGSSRPFQLLPISARTKEAVEASTANLRSHLEKHPELPLADVAHTLQTGRHQFNQRRVIVCQDRDEALAYLGSEAAQEHPTLVPARHNPPVVFMFPGQGSQRVNMGRELYENESLYREIVDRCSDALVSELDLDLRDVLFPSPDKVNWAEEHIVQTRITQPALFVTEYALAQLWISWGIQPTAMIGHSVGEYVAACLAGVFSLDDGLRLIAGRGRLIQEQPTGTMLAVMADEDDVRSIIRDGVSIATINAKNLCVVSGSHDDIALMEEALTDSKVEYRPLHTSHAFHSIMMEPVVAPFTELLRGVELKPPQIPFVSNLTAEWISDDDAVSPDYWAQHLRQAVRYADGASVLLQNADEQVLLEVGPGVTLTSLTRMSPSKKSTHVIVPSLASDMLGQQSEVATVLSTLGRVWQAGVDVDWSEFYANESRKRVPLPSYPFERKHFFIEPGRLEGVLAAPAKVQDQSVTEVELDASSTEAPISSREHIVERLQECLQSVSGLSVEELGLNKRFLELGFDSLLMSRVCSAIDIAFGIPVTLRQIAEEFSSVALLADYIESAIPDGSDTTADGSNEIQEPLEVTDAKVDTSLPMLDAQREVWLASHLDQDVSRTYNESRVVRVEGPLQVEALRASLQAIVDRHDALRAIFGIDGSGQTIVGQIPVELSVHSLTKSANDEDLEQQLDGLIRESMLEVFDLATGPLFRFSLYDLGDQRWAIQMVMHHIIADGWSWAVIMDQLGEIYTANVEDKTPPDRPGLRYSEYVSWAESEAQISRSKAAEEYWLKLLADKPGEIDLPADRPRPPQKTYDSERVRHEFGADLFARLKRVAQNLDCTMFHLLTASFYVWLHRVTGEDDLIVAVPTAGQLSAGLNERRYADRLVCHCVNMLPIRLNADGHETFRDFVQRAKVAMLDARDHQDVSFGSLINKLEWPRDPSRTPLASVSLNFGHNHQVQLLGLETETLLPPKPVNYFDLTVDLVEGDGEMFVDSKFNRDLFDEATVQRWLGQWDQLLDAVIDDPEAIVSDLDILTVAESDELLGTCNATSQEFPREACLQHLIDEQVRRVPDRIAVVSDGIEQTYCEIDSRANRIARELRARGVQRNQHVGVCLDRSTDMIAALLGILKAGAAYVPLDPSFPEERLRFMAEDADLALLVSTADLADILALPPEQRLLLDADSAVLDSQPNQPLDPDSELDARAEDPAYVIYTSGSTGKPKGVVVPHRAVVNFLTSMARRPGLTDSDVLVAVTTLSFDIAVLELYLPLTQGAKVVVAGRDDVVDGYAIRDLLKENGATIMQATPVTWRLLLAAGWKGDSAFKALVGGEALPKDLAQQLLQHNVQLWNMYGPTETTVWSTCAHIADVTNGITIGKPIDNTSIYILDKYQKICPIGTPGEMFIGGDGVALEYWKRPDLTADRFIEDRFGGRKGGKIYGTGDQARWLSDGTLEHLGRLDDQVKVRGFRIELGDIEAHIVQHPAVHEAVVIAREYGSGDQRLIAFYVSENGSEDLAGQLREFLLSALPDYMVPGHFVELDELPRTQNGKLNRKALPEIDVSVTRSDSAITHPETETEKLLADIWVDVLGTSQVGIDENFFELGGHSLLAMQIAARLRQVLSIVLPLRDFMTAPTISMLAARVDGIKQQSEDSNSGEEVGLWSSTSRPSDLEGAREEIEL